MNNEDRGTVGLLSGGVGFLLLVVVGIVCLAMYGCPRYVVYQQALHGEAELKKAEYTKQVIMQDAHAKREAAKDLAQAEVERAKGVAEANKIIGEGLKGNHEYLVYLWIHGIADNPNREIVYVPTEANLPILEASRFGAMPKKK